MRLLFSILGIVAMLASSLFGQQANTPSLSYYLPAAVDYNPEIPTPTSVLGRRLGSWHFTASEIEMYMKVLSNASERVTFKEIGYSHEGRRLYVLFISNKENQEKLEAIRARHVQVSDPLMSKQVNLENEPVVVWQGHTIHGNEPSGSHAAMAYAYHLAAAEDKQTMRWLERAVIILDPCMNPDGLQRFASWVNSHQSQQLASDPVSREFHEAWPGGRTNHYWFDLNRDWLPAQHPESKARLALFHEWKPNVLTDHHEMGSNSTYFFQPGVPSRNNPMTPANTFDLTYKFAEYHAHALDSIGTTYFTGERYDDFYYGKGSTYPDVNGAVGILFEQASSRGHAQETTNGLLTFPYTIRNQVNTSFSTLKGAVNMRLNLLNHQRDFYTEALDLGQKSSSKGWLFTDDSDPVRCRKFLDVLDIHQVYYEEVIEDVRISEVRAEKHKAFFVPNAQAQYRLITSMFEQRTSFTDSIFYDVSAWTFPLAYGLPFVEVKNEKIKTNTYRKELKGEPRVTLRAKTESPVGYVLPWDQYGAPSAALSLLQQSILCKVAFSSFTDSEGRVFEAGTIFIPTQNQQYDPEQLLSIVQRTGSRCEVDFHALKSGLSTQGINLGSTEMKKLELPRVAIIVGEGISPYEAGSLWNYLDTRLKLPVTLLEVEDVTEINLRKYNTVILPGGSYGKSGNGALSSFVQRGGLLIAQKRALYALQSMNLSIYGIEYSGTNPQGHYSFEEKERVRGSQVLGGAIFETTLDLSHPLCFGFQNKQQAMFRNSRLVIKPNGTAYRYPVKYTSRPLMAGYASNTNIEDIATSAAVVAHITGRGRVVAFADETCFRGFWLGTERFMANAILFGNLIE